MTDDTPPASEPVAEAPAAPAEPVQEAAPVPDPVVVAPEAEVPEATEPIAIPEPALEVAPEENSTPEVIEAPAVESAPTAPTAVQSPPPPPIAQQTPAPASQWNKVDPARARAGRKQRVEENLEKIVAHARTTEWITNDTVEKLLHVSNATAHRYLNMLVVRGKLFRSGKGRGIRYTIVL